MLEKCLVGNLILSQTSSDNVSSGKNSSTKSTPTKKDSTLKPLKTEIEKISNNESDVIDYKLIKLAVNQPSSKPDEIPVFDSYQSNDTVNIVIYTKCKNLKSDCVVIDKNLDKRNILFIHVYTTNGVYKFTLGKYFFRKIKEARHNGLISEHLK
jgi:hypothetical protein